MYCRNCGKQIPDGVKFCPACGTVQTAAQPTTQAAQPSAQASVVKKPIGFILMIVVLVAAALIGTLLIAPSMGNPCEKAEQRFYKLNSFEDIIRKGPDIADLLLGMVQTDIDRTVFETLVANGPDYYFLPDDWHIQGKDVDLSMKCENGRVISVEIDILGGGGLREPELAELADDAISVYGTEYEQTEWGNYIHYTWTDTDLQFEMFNDGTGVASFKFT